MSNEKTKACGHPLDSYSHCWECTLVEARRSGEFSIRGATTLADAAPSAPQPASSPVAAEGQKVVEWGYAKTVGNAIAQLQTMDSALPFYAALHLQDGRCIARGVTFSRERVVNERWIDSTNKEVPYSIVVWSQPVQSLYATPTASMADAAEAAKCECGDRLASECDEQWGPNCDMGNNAAHVRVSTVDPAVIDAALAAPGPRGENAGGVVEAWQPIATAPRDGTELLLWRDDCGQFIGSYTSGDSFPLTQDEIDMMAEEVLFQKDWFTQWPDARRLEGSELPTHWQHLPPDRGLRIAEKGGAS
jgi:hypothetical protein